MSGDPVTSAARDGGTAIPLGVRELRWGVADQALSSLVNFLLAVVVARHATPREFGVFSLAFSLYIFLLWISRALSTDPFVVRFTGRSGPEEQRAATDALGCAAAFGLLTGSAASVVGGIAHVRETPIILCIAVALPAFLAQDAYRYVLFARRQARSAATNDLVWLVAFAATAGALLGWGRPTPAWLVGAFATAALAAAVVGRFQTGVAPALGGASGWVARHRDLAFPTALEHMALAGMVQVSMFGVATVAGSVAVGAVRAAVVLMGPVSVAFLGLTQAAFPHAVRLREFGRQRVRRFIAVVGVGMPAIALAWVVTLVLVPDRLGVSILGASWSGGRRVLPAVGAMVAGNGCTALAATGLRALEQARRSLTARLAIAPGFLVGAVVGSALAGASGAAMGLAIAAWVDAGVSWVVFWRAAQDDPGLPATWQESPPADGQEAPGNRLRTSRKA